MAHSLPISSLDTVCTACALPINACMRGMPVVLYCNRYFCYYLLLQGEDYDARCSELVVGHTHCLPKFTDVDELVIGVKMIQLSDSHKLSLCI